MDSDFFIIKRKSDGARGGFPIIKLKLRASLAGRGMKLFILDRWTQTVIISLKSESHGIKNDVHTAEILILSAFLRNDCYIMAGLSQ